jgi:hypothetical protein
VSAPLFVLLAACVCAARAALYDCLVSGCSGRGECGFHHGSALAFCLCEAGFRGVSCAVQPPKLLRAWLAPGSVSKNSPAFFRVERFHAGDEIELTRVSADSATPWFVASVNEVPNATHFQHKSTALSEQTAFLKLPLGIASGPPSDVLFVTVLADSSSRALFEIVLDRGGEREEVPTPAVPESLSPIAALVVFAIIAFIAMQVRKSTKSKKQ